MPNTEADSAIHVVAGIIRHPKINARIFFARRAKGQHLEDMWEFPGGKLENGESRFQALRRELMEETGIHVHSAQPYHSLIHRYQDKVIYLDVWEVKNYSGVARGREGQEYEWRQLEELSSYSFPQADLPVLSALSLPSELLITPNLDESKQDAYLQQFSSQLSRHLYPLVLFHSHHLADKSYAHMAEQMRQVCEVSGSELIISRPSLKSMKLKLFDDYSRRHIDSMTLRSLDSNPFSETLSISASCHNSEELLMAEKLNCQFALLSSVRSSAGYNLKHAKGWFHFNKLVLQSAIPVYAAGGVKRKDLSVARYQGAIGVAGMSDFWYG